MILLILNFELLEIQTGNNKIIYVITAISI